MMADILNPVDLYTMHILTFYFHVNLIHVQREFLRRCNCVVLVIVMISILCHHNFSRPCFCNIMLNLVTKVVWKRDMPAYALII